MTPSLCGGLSYEALPGIKSLHVKAFGGDLDQLRMAGGVPGSQDLAL